MKKLLRLSLQFFGETADDDFEDFEDVDDVEDTYDDFEESDNEPEDDDYETEDDEDEDAESDKGDDAASNTDEEEPAKTSNGSDALLDELRMLGYVGDDIAAITADIKAKREARQSNNASEERRAKNAEGKGHIKSGKPGKSASGDGTGGVSESRVIDFAARTGRSRSDARQILAKHAKSWN